MNKLVLATFATAFATNIAVAQPAAEAGDMLVDASGRTLYTFDKDAANRSNCNGSCAATWPPYLVKETDRAPVGSRTITRDDGTAQWALNEKPLYFFAADVKAGDARGDGQGGVWHVVRSARPRSEVSTAGATRSVEAQRSYGGSY